MSSGMTFAAVADLLTKRGPATKAELQQAFPLRDGRGYSMLDIWVAKGKLGRDDVGHYYSLTLWTRPGPH